MNTDIPITDSSEFDLHENSYNFPPASDDQSDETQAQTPLEDPTGTSAHELSDNSDIVSQPESSGVGDTDPEHNNLKALFEGLEARKLELDQMVEDDFFMRNVRALYQHDPLAATELMMRKFRDETMERIESGIVERIHRLNQTESDLERLILNHDAVAMAPFKSELKTLLNRGFTPNEAANLIQSLTDSHLKSKTRTQSAAKRVRRQSVMEMGSEPTDQRDRDQAFNLMLKNSRSLEDIFDGLRKLEGKRK